MSVTPVLWDLSDLYSGVDDPRLDADCDQLLQRARAFEERFCGKIDDPGCTVSTLLGALEEFEAIHRQLARPGAYARLLFSADTSDPARGALLQRMQVAATGITRHLIFFPIEMGRMPEDCFASLAGAPELEAYRHYLEYERSVARHHLSEAEEKIVEELGNTGLRAFVRLFSESTSRAVFRLETPEGVRELNQSQILALFYDPDRETRRRAAAAFTATLDDQEHLVTFIYNTLLQEKATMDRLRGYDYPEQSRHEGNELDPEVVSRVVEVVVDGQGLVADYYRLKARLLGLDTLTHYDRYAPISGQAEEIPFEQGREVVLDAFASFSPRVAELMEPFFSRRWIDAEVRPGKRGGAFCGYISPELHPYVFMNYTNRPRDVMTLAHELGHALHGVLASHHHCLNYYPSLPMAETASVFAEMLVFERLQQRLESPASRLGLLCGKLEDTFATVFRQVAMYRFEQAAHQAYRAGGEQTSESYGRLWQQYMQEMFGNALQLGDEHSRWWRYIPHIFATPFYVYAYAFGELLVLALYARYRQEGPAFVEHYLELLAVGGSRKPADMLAEIGIDIRKREFWQGGMDLIRGMLQQAQACAREAGLDPGPPGAAA